MSETKVVLESDAVRRALKRIAHEIVERNSEQSIALVGIHRRGSYLAKRLAGDLQELVGKPIEIGDIDISFYRDDIGQSESTEAPVVHSTHLDFPLESKTVILVDDVLFTGRTARAGIEALFDYGRPARVQLAVLIDRGHRELPIRPDYIGKNLPTSRSERVNVCLQELDGSDRVEIASYEGQDG